MATQGEAEDRRREAAIASAASLRPNFKSVGVSQDQLAKFQELHRRRLQIKSKSKVHKKSKDGRKKNHDKDLDTVDTREKNPDTKVEDITSSNLEIQSKGDNPSLYQESSAVQFVPKPRQKLHWGLDTKERWERKANM